ncbi:phage tail protein, partial [Escherichia coli]|nr:phage tail protein [Escherichia coli]MBZ8407076.1 phage tail protein [Escherichia coli]MBZ8440556.1 phage tail protein [Escherichia coli]MBZ8445554.1 phage tail protein [Escherichia coli]MBZ8450556.1 phage tail protein [Escherichia coli]
LRFESVRRTADVIEDSIQEAMLPYVDRPLDRDVADDILGSINAYMRQLKNLGAIHGGSAWLNDELNTAENLAAGWLYIDYDFGPKSPLERLTLRTMINNKLAQEELTV